MLTVRLIPVLYLMDGKIVRSERFSQFKIIGDPVHELARYDQWDVDEVVYVDITRGGTGIDTELLRSIASRIFSPLTVGGNVKTLDDVARLIRNGADKVLICSEAWRSGGELISRASEKFGAQAVVAGVDFTRDGVPCVDQGVRSIPGTAVSVAKQYESWGAGEIFLNSIDRDGAGTGYAIDTIAGVANAVGIPVIAGGGAAGPSDFLDCIAAGASPAAGNYFHFTENAYNRAKQYLHRKGINVRLDRAVVQSAKDAVLH